MVSTRTTATWGTAATAENKFLMVCERTLYRHIPILCQHICQYVDMYPYYVDTCADMSTYTNLMSTRMSICRHISLYVFFLPPPPPFHNHHVHTLTHTVPHIVSASRDTLSWEMETLSCNMRKKAKAKCMRDGDDNTPPPKVLAHTHTQPHTPHTGHRLHTPHTHSTGHTHPTHRPHTPHTHPTGHTHPTLRPHTPTHTVHIQVTLGGHIHIYVHIRPHPSSYVDVFLCYVDVNCHML